MASLFSVVPAGCPVPFATLNAAARSGGCFLVLSSDGARAKAMAAALHAATKGRGLVLSSAVVARASKRSGRVGDGQGEENFGEDGDKATGKEMFTKDGGKAKAEDDKATGEEKFTKDGGNFLLFGAGTGEDLGSSEITMDELAVMLPKETAMLLKGGGKQDDDKATGEDHGSAEITMEELAVMFHKETAMMLKGVNQFPPGRDGDNLSSLIASCNAIGDQLRDVGSSEGRTTTYHNLIALHLRIVSCAGGAEIRNPGSYLPDMWAGHRYRLPSKAKRAGTLMELLLLSRMLAGVALAKYVDAPEWDFTGME